eukprot:COSAG06_NODE_673_length_13189_cov_211.299312_6_plen_310_part_00
MLDCNHHIQEISASDTDSTAVAVASGVPSAKSVVVGTVPPDGTVDVSSQDADRPYAYGGGCCVIVDESADCHSFSCSFNCSSVADMCVAVDGDAGDDANQAQTARVGGRPCGMDGCDGSSTSAEDIVVVAGILFGQAGRAYDSIIADAAGTRYVTALWLVVGLASVSCSQRQHKDASDAWRCCAHIAATIGVVSLLPMEIILMGAYATAKMLLPLATVLLPRIRSALSAELTVNVGRRGAALTRMWMMLTVMLAMSTTATACATAIFTQNTGISYPRMTGVQISGVWVFGAVDGGWFKDGLCPLPFNQR